MEDDAPARSGDPPHERALLVLTALLLTAVAVSMVHYADNYFNYEDFPQTDAIPAPSATLVGLAWFGFTAFGVAGYLLFRRRRYRIASLCLGLYAGSGLVGVGHYLSAGMTSAVRWRQAHVVADILLGMAMLTFAVWTATRGRERHTAVAARS